MTVLVGQTTLSRCIKNRQSGSSEKTENFDRTPRLERAIDERQCEGRAISFPRASMHYFQSPQNRTYFSVNPKTIRILGIRGIPAAHGGFETFAENLALHLVENGWRVIVYCQIDGKGPTGSDTWRGVERVNVQVSQPGPMGTILFDWKSIVHASQSRDLCLTLGYNTAIFCSILRVRGIRNVINMDGIEWARAKWSKPAKVWFWINERIGCWLGNHLVADHPEIKRHLSKHVCESKITTIAYGAPHLVDEPVTPIEIFNIEPEEYISVIARPEPENSLLEIVEGFSSKRRGVKLLVLGKYDEHNVYHRAVKNSASDEVIFAGAIYDKAILSSIRFHSLAYVHGHQVGGTNPSLVEALGAGNAILAHDNRFNRWVSGNGALFFRDASSFSILLDEILANRGRLAELRAHSRKRFAEALTWPRILKDYEDLLTANLQDTAEMRRMDVNSLKGSK